MKQYILLIFLVLQAIPAAATINLTEPLEESYFIGSTFSPIFAAQLGERYAGIFRVAIHCPAYRVEYFATPLSLEPQETRTVPVPPLSLSRTSEGECTLAARLQAIDNEDKEAYESPTFTITKNVPVVVSLNVSSIKPGDDIHARYAVPDHYVPKETKIRYRLGNATWYPGSNEATISTPKNIPAGEHIFTVKLTDRNDNLGENYTTLAVASVPSRIGVNANTYRARTGSAFVFTGTILDQTNTALEGLLIHRLSDANGNVIFETTTASETPVRYTFPPAIPPGTFTLRVLGLDMRAERSITLEITEQVEVTLRNGIVNLTNTGNVDYTHEFIVEATNTERSVVLEGTSNIKPGDSATVDMQRELPAGIYTVKVTALETKMFNDVLIDDQRPFFKKAAQFFTATGNVAAVRTPSSPVSAVTAIAVVILLGLFILRRHLVPKREKRHAESAAIPQQRPPTPKENIREREDVKRFIEQSLKKE